MPGPSARIFVESPAARGGRQNGGLSLARNIGLAHATGEIVAYTDADVRGGSDVAGVSRPAVHHVGRGRLRRTKRRARPMTRASPSAWRERRVVRPTCCSTIASPSTCRAATWRFVPTRSWRSAGSTRSTFAPATTWMSAGGCRPAAGALVSRPRRSSGTGIARPSRATGASRSATVKAKLAGPQTSRQVHRRRHAVAGPHLQRAPVRARALSRSAEHGHLGHGGVSVGLQRRRVRAHISSGVGGLARAGPRADARGSPVGSAVSRRGARGLHSRQRRVPDVGRAMRAVRVAGRFPQRDRS